MILEPLRFEQEPSRCGQLSKQVVYVVDDDPELCRSVSWLMDGCGIKTETFDSAESFLAADRDPAGCLLLDVRMPGMDGLELQQRLSRVNRWPAVVIMSGHADVPMALRALEGGAVTFLEKPFTRERLLACLDEAWAKSAEQLAQQRLRAEDERRIAHLTPREREVFGMVIAGTPTKNIARTLDVSTRTVDKHRERILAKTGIDSWAELVALGVRLRMGPGAACPCDNGRQSEAHPPHPDPDRKGRPIAG